MGNVTIKGVQKILHLDVNYPYFDSWEEILDFEVDGVQVQAMVTHRWREDIVKVTKPFQAHGDDYYYTCRPPFIAVAAAMKARLRALAARGLTVRDDCLRMATGIYREHSTYLRLKPEIDREQDAFLNVFRDELERLFNEDARAQEHFRAQRLELRRKLRNKEIEPKLYNKTLSGLQKQARFIHSEYTELQDDVDRELKNIKLTIIYRALKPHETEKHPWY